MRISVGRRTTGYAASALCALMLLSACGSAGDRATDASTQPSPTTSSSPSGSATNDMPSNGRARPTVMVGRVTSVEDGCIVFKNDRDAHQWVLIGETTSLTPGAAYEIQGVAMDSMDTRCPAALPFQVTDATPRMNDNPGPLPPSTSPGTGTTTSLTGTVSNGVEPGCRVLKSEQGNFVLVGSIPVPNGRVTVTGTRSIDQISTCQQGLLFEVHTVTPAN